MKIRNKLTFLFTAIIATLMGVFALAIYFSFSANREEDYYKVLRRTAITKANLLLDAKVEAKVLQLIYHNSENSLFEEEVAIYDTSFNLLYHDAVEIDKVKETRQMIDGIVRKKEIKFYQGDLQVVGFLYRHNFHDYVITSAANDQFGYAKLRNLRYTLGIAFLVAIILIPVLMDPIMTMIRREMKRKCIRKKIGSNLRLTSLWITIKKLGKNGIILLRALWCWEIY